METETTIKRLEEIIELIDALEIESKKRFEDVRERTKALRFELKYK
jgi:hypothetical protein